MNEFNANKQINSYMFPSDYTELYLFLNSKNAKMLYLNRFGLAVNKTQLQQLRIENNKNKCWCIGPELMQSSTHRIHGLWRVSYIINEIFTLESPKQNSWRQYYLQQLLGYREKQIQINILLYEDFMHVSSSSVLYSHVLLPTCVYPRKSVYQPVLV